MSFFLDALMNETTHMQKIPLSYYSKVIEKSENAPDLRRVSGSLFIPADTSVRLLELCEDAQAAASLLTTIYLLGICLIKKSSFN